MGAQAPVGADNDGRGSSEQRIAARASAWPSEPPSSDRGVIPIEPGDLVRPRGDVLGAVSLVLAVDHDGVLFVHHPERWFCRVGARDYDVVAEATDDSRAEARMTLEMGQRAGGGTR